MMQVQRVGGGYCIRVGEAGENGEIEGANELVFTDANFNVKFRVKLDFDFDKLDLAADGLDGWRGHFINEPNELRVLDIVRSEAGGFEDGSSGEFMQGEASKSRCEATDKFEYDEPFKFKLGEQVQYLAAKPVLAHKFKQKGTRILGVITAASCRAASTKSETEQNGAFAEQNLAPEGSSRDEKEKYSLLAPGKNEKRRHRALEFTRDLILVDNAYDEDTEQILTCYEI